MVTGCAPNQVIESVCESGRDCRMDTEVLDDGSSPELGV